VLHCDPNIPSSVEVYYLVDDVLAAVAHYAGQGCQVLVAAFDLTIGKCAAIKDPFGTRLYILDMTRGALLSTLLDQLGEVFLVSGMISSAPRSQDWVTAFYPFYQSSNSVTRRPDDQPVLSSLRGDSLASDVTDIPSRLHPAYDGDNGCWRSGLL
jgi:hypothetical protein